MCTPAMNERMRELAKLRIMRAELEELIIREEDAIKTFMKENELTELVGLEHKVSYKAVISTRVDTTALKKIMPEIAAQFMRSSSSMRFLFS